MLVFSAGASANPLNNRKEKAENLFTAAIETELEFEEVKEKGLSVFAKIRALFADKEKTDDERFADQTQAIELLAEQTKETLEKLTALSWLFAHVAIFCTVLMTIAVFLVIGIAFVRCL